MQRSPDRFSPYPQAGEVLEGKYRVEEILGQDDWCAVAKATDLVGRAPVALKFMSGASLSIPEAVDWFVNAGMAASRIEGDHIVKVFGVGRLPSGAPYLAMEFLDGRDLGDLILEEGPRIEPVRAVHFCLQILRALHAGHAAGILHRDMKPSSFVVIQKDGKRDFLKLADFGTSPFRIATTERGPNLAGRPHRALGLPLYMSPEQARSPGEVDSRSDIYAVGAILYEMLCGRAPYASDSGEYPEILLKILTTDPENVRAVHPGVSDGLASVVHRALLREREDRFANALDMAEALAPFADERSAALIATMRSARGRSGAAPPMVSFSRATSPSTSEGAGAETYANVDPKALRAPRVPTGVGLSRSAGKSRSIRRVAVVAIAVAVASVVLFVAGGVLMVRLRGPAPPATAASPATTGR